MISGEKAKNWIVIGSGLTGLACAQRIERDTNDNCMILEQSLELGGKLKTELFEQAYLLDHGFQVLLPAYSELKENVDLNKLDLCFFESGAIIHSEKGITHISDPLRNPLKIFETLFSNVGSFKDKLLVMKLRAQVCFQSDEVLLQNLKGSSYQFLKDFGFSEDMIQNFWQPFFSGIFLENKLETEGSFLQFLFKMFSLSAVAVPNSGIQQLPKLMAANLKRTQIRFNCKVTQIESDRVTLGDGTQVSGKIVDARPVENAKWGAVTTLYYAAAASPVKGPWLVLNSRNLNRLVNHVAVMSEVSPTYALKGDALISVNVLKGSITDSELMIVKKDLKDMFGEQTSSWRFLKSFEIPQALPLYFAPSAKGITPSQQGAFIRAKSLFQAGM